MDVKLAMFFKIAKNLWALVFGILSIILTFVSWENLEILDVCLKIKILLVLIVVVAIISFVWTLLSHSKTVWKCGNAKVRVKYGEMIIRIYM